jgi:hypothetical protein
MRDAIGVRAPFGALGHPAVLGAQVVNRGSARVWQAGIACDKTVLWIGSFGLGMKHAMHLAIHNMLSFTDRCGAVHGVSCAENVARWRACMPCCRDSLARPRAAAGLSAFAAEAAASSGQGSFGRPSVRSMSSGALVEVSSPQGLACLAS